MLMASNSRSKGANCQVRLSAAATLMSRPWKFVFFILAFLPRVPLRHHVTMRLLDYLRYSVHRRLFVCSLAG